MVVDLFSRQLVGWSLHQDLARELVIDALRRAWIKRPPGKGAGLIFHSDRGSQYASKDFRDVLTEYGITASVSRRGNCWDNSCSESLFGSLKVERLHERLRFMPSQEHPWHSGRVHGGLAGRLRSISCLRAPERGG